MLFALKRAWLFVMLVFSIICFSMSCSNIIDNNGVDEGIYVGYETPPPAGFSDATKPTPVTQPVVKATPSPTQMPTNTPSPAVLPQYNIDPTKPMIALTFDDGPHDTVTPRILDLLERYDIRATFFVVGDRLNRHSNVVQRAYELGCEFGNHTFTHKTRFSGLTRSELYELLDPTDDALAAIIGIRTKMIRPPGGFYDNNTLECIDRPILMWSVDTKDWQSRDSAAVLEHLKNDVFDGAIILMHDLYNTTADACEQAIPWYIEQGYQLVTVSEMFQARGIALEAGKVYSKAPSAAQFLNPTPTPSPSPSPTPVKPVQANGVNN